MKKILAFAAAFALLLCAASLFAQEDQTETLKFAKGSSSTTVSGAVIHGTRNNYLVGAKAGQTMTVVIHSKQKEGDATFTIYLPGSTTATLPGAGESDEGKRWEGKLPATGTYTISVGPGWGNGTYSLDVSIK